MKDPTARKKYGSRSGQSRSGQSGRRLTAIGFQLLGAVLVVSSVIVGVFASHAGASPLSSGPVQIKVASGATVATNPLFPRQVVTVSVSSNSTLSRSSLEAAGFKSGAVAIKIEECADPGGTTANLPTTQNSCEPLTIDSQANLQADGSVLEPGYTVFALPDPNDLGVSNGTVCDGGEHECVLGIFTNQHDFTKPHLFSAPFQVVSTSTNSGTATAGGANSSGGRAISSQGASAGVSVPPATLANTGGPTLWPWLLGAGAILLILGTILRYRQGARAREGRP